MIKNTRKQIFLQKCILKKSGGWGEEWGRGGIAGGGHGRRGTAPVH
jgi:hypothetical protein